MIQPGGRMESVLWGAFDAMVLIAVAVGFAWAMGWV
jgi:hypothetical protein